MRKPNDSSPMDMDIPPLHPKLDLLPTAPIPPIYVIVPSPTSCKGQREKNPTSCISQPSEVSLVLPSTKKEEKPMLIDPQPSQASNHTKRNHSVKEC